MILLPLVASIDGRSASSWFWMEVALAIEDDHMVDDIPTVDASQGKDSASSLVDDLWYSQTGTAGALHHLSLLHDCTLLRRSIQVVACN